MKSNWNQPRLSAVGALHGLRAMPVSGWRGGYKRTGKQTGYHKCLPLADMKLLAWQVESGIDPVDTSKQVEIWLRDHGL